MEKFFIGERGNVYSAEFSVNTTCRAVNLYLELGEKESNCFGNRYYKELVEHINLDVVKGQAVKYINTLSEILAHTL